jgi:hypothetical protein
LQSACLNLLRRWTIPFVTALTLVAPTRGLCGQQYQTFAPFMLRSDGTGEFASSRYEFAVETSGTLEVRYGAPREHCASLRLHLFVDNHKAADTAPIAPGQQTEYINLGPVPPGKHSVSLQAEGIEGGCNTGRVTAWGGTVTVWTSVQGSVTTTPAATLGDIVFEVESTNYAWGYLHSGRYITANGDVVGFRIPADRAHLLPGASADGLYSAEALAAKFENQCRALWTLPPASIEHAKTLALALAHLPPGEMTRHEKLYDAGETVYVVYVATGAKDRYRRIVLAERGDYESDNAAPQAAELRHWLDQNAPYQ